MSIPKKGGYSGSRPASEMGPPANLPSATIRPTSREHTTTTKDCWCQPDVEQVSGRSEYDAKPDWTLYLNAMRLVEDRRALVADVDLPGEYAKAAAAVTAELILDLAYAQADARHWHEGWKRANDQVTFAVERERVAKDDAATHAEREGIQEAKVREFARQARDGERLRRKIRSLVSAPEGWHAYNAPNARGDIVQHHVAFTTTDTLRVVLDDDAADQTHIDGSTQ